MVYVDLKPIGSKMALTPELSDHTSVKKGIELLAIGEAYTQLHRTPGWYSV
ncbi:MAG: hypothetical protein ACI9FR_003382 [Cryomorphaceae bacterium]|jgi:hypothetical protein